MKVFFEDLLHLSLFYKNKKMNISKSELSSKSSKVTSFPEAILLLCGLPYIEWIKYDKAEHSLTYRFRNATISYDRLIGRYEENYEQETLSEISEEIEKIFEKYFC